MLESPREKGSPMTMPNRRAELVAELERGIGELVTSDRWRAHLEVQSRFRQYSFGNVTLIASQCPDATRVAGFQAWRGLGRSVRRGERAIWILAPMLAPREEDRRAASKGHERVVRGFKAVPVFDVSQTDGPDLPSVCAALQGSDDAGAYDRLVGFGSMIGFAVEDRELEAGTNGDCSHEQHLIRVERRNQPAQRVKTLAHEIAHALLHETFEDRSLAELEAESVAYVVCRSLGFDASGYSFGYVALWAGGGERAIAGVRSSGERIQKAAARILSGIGGVGAGEEEAA